MPSAETKYHWDCYTAFLKSAPSDQKPGRPVCPIKKNAFETLIEKLENDNKSQYSLKEIQELFSSYIPNNKMHYTDKWLKRKLQDHFGDNIIFTEGAEKSITTFRENAYSILKESWKNKWMDTEEEKSIIIDMAAAIIRDSIRSKTYDMDQYPDMRCLDIQGDVPCEVDRFMKGVIKTKSKAIDNVMHRRIIAISHSMISACRLRSYISRVMLALSILCLQQV